ncbi:MAG: PepSY-like domain-containing protein [Chitinophagaceae bacterium]
MNYLRLLALALTVALVSCNKESIVSEDDLPADAAAFVSTHFPSQEIIRVIKERDDLKNSYYVYLDDGTKIEFTRSGKLKEIESHGPLPESIFPVKVLDYVAANYPGTYIRKWDVEGSTHEARLSNDLELVFDELGNFLRVED